jgi:hypothetical protein
MNVGHRLQGHQPTHPDNIHEILLLRQHVDPGYEFKI